MKTGLSYRNKKITCTRYQLAICIKIAQEKQSMVYFFRSVEHNTYNYFSKRKNFRNECLKIEIRTWLHNYIDFVNVFFSLYLPPVIGKFVTFACKLDPAGFPLKVALVNCLAQMSLFHFRTKANKVPYLMSWCLITTRQTRQLPTTFSTARNELAVVMPIWAGTDSVYFGMAS